MMTSICRRMMFSLKNYFRHLNLFQPVADSGEEENEQQRHFNILVTRVYIVLLIFLLIGFALFTKFKVETTIMKLQNPTEKQFDVLPIDADCPCSQISLSYGEFISLHANLHEICRSEFVSNRWIKAIFSGSNSTYFNVKDFRTFGTAQFQALSGFCNISYSYLQQHIDLFKRTMLISTHIRSKINFQQEIQLTLAQFKQTVSRPFATQLKFVRQMIMNNRLVSGLQTNFHISYSAKYHPAIYAATYNRINKTSCNCLVDSECSSNAVFDSIFGAQTQYQSGNITIIPGLASGCLPMGSILASTLECFYNQTCLDELISFFPTKEKFSAMIVNNQSRFKPFTIVRSIVNDLMVEDWITDVSYTKYFNGCASLLCTYVKVKRQTWQFVLTQLISLLAALIMVLQILVPIIVRIVMDKINKVVYPKISLRIRLQELEKTAKKSIIELNLFKSFPSNDRQVRHQCYATRLYIILIVLSFSTLTLYNITIKRIRYHTITNPSEFEYLNLEKDYLDDLTCSCTSLSTSYSSFLTIQPHYHHLCSSYLITSQWIEFVRPKQFDKPILFEYEHNAATYFQTLAMLCEQAKIIINNTLDDSLQRRIVGLHVMRSDFFHKQMIQLIHNWKDSTISQFKRSINITQLTISTNQVMNRQNIFYQYSSKGKQVITEPRQYDKCSCAYEKCQTLMKIYHHRDSNDFFLIPNFFVGCYPIDALLQSTLECFYNQLCNEKLHSYFTSSSIESWTFPALNSSLNSANETIQSIVDKLMVDDNWLQNTNFTSYYSNCAPSSCVIEYMDRYHILTILIIVSGIFSGLSFALQKFIWVGLHIIEKLFEGNSFQSFLNYIRTLFNWSDTKKVTNRLHVILVILALYSLYMYHAFRSDLITVETEKPKLNAYQELVAEHADTLHCYCSEISIQYRSFLNITPRFHPMCSRNIVKELWNIISTISFNDYAKNFTAKYGYVGVGYLLGIDRLCKLSKEILVEALNQLLTSHFVNNQLLSEASLTEHIRLTINDFQIRVPRTLTNIYALTRLAVTANHLMNTYGSSWVFVEQQDLSYSSTLHSVPVVEQDCNCGLTAMCMKEVFGINFGCYITETMWQSPIKCLYDRKCLDIRNKTNPLDNSSERSRFPINSSFELVLNELMMENLDNNESYEDYFANCEPFLCTHSIQNNNLIEGITVLISLYGGVVIICHSIAVVLIKLLQRRPTEITPTTD
ncbi:unnamed protein product [Adineta ricciae]|uniref:Uncharacterized protein n=1 Tax=Adineta ricciae TaxID=249248 RepID=A0A814XDV9_ADIRI|nr:unnamed protein product [Adineta ricciae]CAF1269673.1 unnamed protein product [Adineta ricciae]